MDTPEQVESGQPQVTQVTAMNAPEPTQTAAPEPTKQDASTAKYGGKTVDELASELAEKDAYISSVNERAARAEHEAMLTRNIVEQFSRERGKPAEPEVPNVTDDEFLTNPAKATGKIIESYFHRERAEREKERVAQYVESARSAYETGKQEAVKSNPNLYRGIQTDIEREVLNNVQASLKAGQPVDTNVLRNPRYWEAAALAMRVMNGEDVSKYYQSKNAPMAPGHTETPTAGLPPQAGTSLTQGEIAMAQFLGGTPEQYAAAKAKGK